jgi:hypothetical protein
MRQERRLGVEGVTQVGIRPCPAQTAERKTEDGIRLLKQAARRRVGIGQRLSHTNNLGSLSGKNEGGALWVKSHFYPIRLELEFTMDCTD